MNTLLYDRPVAGDFSPFGDETSFDDANIRVDEWLAGIEERASKARELSGLVAGLTATASNSDRSITVTVSSSGALSDIRIDDAVRRHSGQWIAQQILATTRAATAQLADRLRDAVDETVGRDSPEGRAVIASFVNRTVRDPHER
jgi:hypothetical protein